MAETIWLFIKALWPLYIFVIIRHIVLAFCDKTSKF